MWLTHRSAHVVTDHGHADPYSSLSHAVHCERGGGGHSGCTDHAPGPEKQHGRRVSQGQQPGEWLEWETWLRVRPGRWGHVQRNTRALLGVDMEICRKKCGCCLLCPVGQVVRSEGTGSGGIGPNPSSQPLPAVHMAKIEPSLGRSSTLGGGYVRPHMLEPLADHRALSM